MKKFLYYSDNSTRASELLKNPSERIDIRKVHISPLSNKHTFAWTIAALLGNVITSNIHHGAKQIEFAKYQLIRGNTVLAWCEVTGWMPAFPFMSRNGAYIGSAYTLPEERGKGYYPYLLCRIQDELPQKDFYIFVDEGNEASIRGVEQAGFRKYATLKKARFGIYLIDELSSSY